MQATSSPVTAPSTPASAPVFGAQPFESEVTTYPPVMITQPEPSRAHLLVRRRQRATRRAIR